MYYLDANTVMFTFIGYPMSYIEFFGTIFNLWCVWLVARNNIWTWPIGIVGIVLFGALFYQIQLYSDLFEQAYFLVTSFYGWAVWLKIRERVKKDETRDVRYTGIRTKTVYAGVIVLLTVGFAYGASHLHLWFPTLFPEPASYPWLDAFTTVMSFAATILMAHKFIECWWLWISVDIIGIGLYYVKDVKLVSLLYLIFLILATRGLLNWRTQYTAESRIVSEVA